MKGWRKVRLSDGSVSFKAKFKKEQLKSPYGNLYTWHTATAGTGTYKMDNYGSNAKSSICPKGWRLPPYEGNKSYFNLLSNTYDLKGNSMGLDKIMSDPLNFYLAGFYDFGQRHIGSMDNGYYWSSNIAGIGDAKILAIGSLYGVIEPQTSYESANGSSVRCVAR